MHLYSGNEFAFYIEPVIAACSFQTAGILPTKESKLKIGATCPAGLPQSGNPAAIHFRLPGAKSQAKFIENYRNQAG